jgi:Flp pilus assembly protein TadD
MRLFDNDESVLAERMQRQALVLVAELGGMPVLEAKIRNNLGVILTCSGRLDEAEAELGRALELIRARIGDGNRVHQIVRMNLRTTLNRQLDRQMGPILAAAV